MVVVLVAVIARAAWSSRLCFVRGKGVRLWSVLRGCHALILRGLVFLGGEERDAVVG